jgi:hypothetical protein
MHKFIERQSKPLIDSFPEPYVTLDSRKKATPGKGDEHLGLTSHLITKAFTLQKHENFNDCQVNTFKSSKSSAMSPAARIRKMQSEHSYNRQGKVSQPSKAAKHIRIQNQLHVSGRIHPQCISIKSGLLNQPNTAQSIGAANTGSLYGQHFGMEMQASKNSQQLGNFLH